MILQGKSTSGIGIAKMWVSKIENIFREKTGMSVFHGTLNIKLSFNYKIQPDFIILPKEYGGTQNVLVKQCKIFGNTAYIVRAEKNQNGTGDYDLQTIEIISDINFRNMYGIKDNDDITLEVWTFLVLKIISLAYNSKSKEIKELYVGDI